MKLKIWFPLMCAAAILLAADPDFEVVAIRPAQALTPALMQSGGVRSRADDSGFDRSNASLMNLIMFAYQVPEDLVSGPNWLNDAFFEVQAKLPADAKKRDVPAMLRRMLEDRFNLRVHRVPRIEQVYLLTVGNQGIKFKESSPDSRAGQKGCATRPYHTQCRSVTIAQWVDGITCMARMRAMAGLGNQDTSSNIDMPVVDQTGLTGVYDFDLQWIPDDLPSAGQGGRGVIAPADPSTKARTIFQAIEAVGLKLEPGKHTVDTVVVDHIERTPTGN